MSGYSITSSSSSAWFDAASRHHMKQLVSPASDGFSLSRMQLYSSAADDQCPMRPFTSCCPPPPQHQLQQQQHAAFVTPHHVQSSDMAAYDGYDSPAAAAYGLYSVYTAPCRLDDGRHGDRGDAEHVADQQHQQLSNNDAVTSPSHTILTPLSFISCLRRALMSFFLNA